MEKKSRVNGCCFCVETYSPAFIHAHATVCSHHCGRVLVNLKVGREENYLCKSALQKADAAWLVEKFKACLLSYLLTFFHLLCETGGSGTVIPLVNMRLFCILSFRWWGSQWAQGSVDLCEDEPETEPVFMLFSL